MKTQTCLLPALLLAAATQLHAQAIFNRNKADKLHVQGNNLNWYIGSLRLTPATNASTASGVLDSRQSGNNRVEFGTGLVRAQEAYAANGTPTRTASGNQVCTSQPMRVDFLTAGDFNIYSAASTMMAGDFYNINSVLNNSFTAFRSPQRRSYQLGISIFNAARNNSMLTVTNTTRSPQPEVQQQLLAPNYGAPIPADGIFDMTEIQSTMQLKTQFETALGLFLPLEEFDIPLDITAGIEGSLNTGASARLKYYMVSFYQPLYTINVLTRPEFMFENQAAFQTCTDGAYVESVTYGRRLVMIVGSADTEVRIKAAVSEALGATVTATEAAGLRVGGSASGMSDAALRTIISRFHANIYGGEGRFANAIFGDIVNFKNGFREYITSASAGVFSARTGAVPLHYTLRRISDNALLAVRSVGNYNSIVDCTTGSYKVEVLWKGIKVNTVIEGPGDDKEDIWGNFKLKTATINGVNSPKDITIKSTDKNRAVSLRANQTDNDDVTVRVLDGMNLTDICNTTLNFSQAYFDWEPVHDPAYRENNSAELKFNLSNQSAAIRNLLPNQSATFDNPVGLTETGPFGSSKITLLTKIRVTRL